mmetsp:Transcript_16966/g.26522  ORF Transcript_16966/g.26522 Transcript_16966/m.26522 type:complete len:275 (+) Transcript_16966:126-950(+)
MLPKQLTLVLLASSFTAGFCDDVDSTIIVPTTSSNSVSVQVSMGKVIKTQKHVVDPWIRPPRGVAKQQAIGMPGDFDDYPKIIATPLDSIEFLMRPVNRVGDNTQRHGVYVITEKQLVQDYLDGKSEHPCGQPVYTSEDLCQVVEYQGLNATNCLSRETLFPLMEIFGASGVIPYTTSDLGALADKYGVETDTGSHILAFDCPWIQGRDDEGSGRTSHCIGGMFQIVEVLSESAVLGDNVDTMESTSGSKNLPVSLWSSAALVAVVATVVATGL